MATLAKNLILARRLVFPGGRDPLDSCYLWKGEIESKIKQTTSVLEENGYSFGGESAEPNVFFQIWIPKHKPSTFTLFIFTFPRKTMDESILVVLTNIPIQ